MIAQGGPKSALVEHLERLARTNNRAALSSLRGSLREGHQFDALRIVLPYIGGDANRRREDDATLLAGLFALNPETGPDSLAGALCRVQGNSGSDSVELRFRALLGVGREDLPVHLRHAVSLVGATHTGLDWENLYRAIRYWDHDSEFVRREWARDYWGSDSADEPTAPEPNTTLSEGTEA